MKKLIYTLLTVSIIFSACEKENNGPTHIETNNNTSASIVGSWDVKEQQDLVNGGYYLGGYPNGNKIITYSNEVISLPGDTSWNLQSLNWTFSSEGSLTEILIDGDGDVIQNSTSYEKSGNTLTIDTNNIWSITTLSSSKLTLNISSEDTNTYYWDPNNDTVYFNEYIFSLKWDRSSFTTDNYTLKRIQSNKASFFKTFIDRKK